MDKNKRISKEEKKQIKIELKNRLAQERMQKIEKRNIEKAKAIEVGTFNSETKAAESDNTRIGKMKKDFKSFFGIKSKKEKEKINWKVAFREFPVKMAKEIGRIRWVPKGSLGKRFLVVIAFIIAFAIFYEIIDQIFFNLLTAVYVI